MAEMKKKSGSVFERNDGLIDENIYEVLDYFEAVTGKVLKPIREWVTQIQSLFYAGYSAKDLCFVVAVKDYEWDGNNINPTVLFSPKFPVYLEECRLSGYMPKKVLSFKEVLLKKFKFGDDFQDDRELYGKQCALIRKLERGEVPERYKALILQAKRCHKCFLVFARDYQDKLKKPVPSRVGHWHKSFLVEETAENMRKYCTDIEFESAEIEKPVSECWDDDTYARYQDFVRKLGEYR